MKRSVIYNKRKVCQMLHSYCMTSVMYDKCNGMTNVTVEEMVSYDKCYCMTNVTVWQVLQYDKCYVLQV